MPLNKVLDPNIPENPLVFCVFCFFVFLEVFGFVVVLVADKSFRNQKPKKNEENQKQPKKKTMPLKKILGPDIPENHVFSVLWCGLI